MKALIWIGTLFLVVLANELLGVAIGFKAGYLVIILLVTFIGKSLTKKWDEKHPKNTEDKENPYV